MSDAQTKGRSPSRLGPDGAAGSSTKGTDHAAAANAACSSLSAESLLAAIVESSDDAIISKSVNGIITSWNKSAERLFGFTASEAIGQHITIIIPAELLHEEDVIIGHIKRGERIEHYETVRHRKDGTQFDISLTVSPVRDQNGVIIGASKIVRDISERKRMAERQYLLLQEMNHRIKNLFAVISSLISLSEKGATTIKALADDLRMRIRALASAHSLTLTPTESGHGADSANLFALIDAVFAPHQNSENVRVTVKGDDVWVEASSLTSFALLLHEFATNAIKYGALSTDEGRIEIEVLSGDDLTLSWIEIGGPPVSVPPSAGFGSRLERVTIEALKGSVTREWHPQGLRIHLNVPQNRDGQR